MLTSTSPRRRLMLQQMGLDFEVAAAVLDDGPLAPGAATSPRHWVAALAYLKAAAVARADPGATILGADTLCSMEGRIIGQARDAAHAAAIIEGFENRDHHVLTGVALLSPENRLLLTDVAVVRVGRIGPERIDEYVSSGDWRGKAGAYNLSERLEAGWPLEVTGDPGTVMGLPIRRLEPLLEPFKSERDA
ncbi:MAG: Maf family nucleotide pyrophosphatase [Phycisphaerales bacterium JB039]